MQLETKVFERIIEDAKEDARKSGIAKLMSVMKQMTRFGCMKEDALYDLAARAWAGKVDLDKDG